MIIKKKCGFTMGLTVSGSAADTANFATNYRALRLAALENRIRTNGCDITGNPNLKNLDNVITQSLSDAFGQSADGYFNFRNSRGLLPEQAILQGLMDNSKTSKPAHIRAPLNTIFDRSSYLTSADAPKDIIRGLINNHPHIKGFTDQDAKTLTEGNKAQQQDVIKRFPNADPSLLSILANVMRGNTTHAITLLTKAEDTPDYLNWERAKRMEITNAILANPALMRDIGGIKYPHNIETAADVAEQLNRKERIAKSMAVIFSKVYDLKTLGPEDVRVIFQSAQTIKDKGFSQAEVYTLAPGFTNDETVVLRENPAFHLMTTCGLTRNDRDEARAFVNRVSEELQHATDSIISDKLMKGTMPRDHVGLQHSTLFLLNTAVYTIDERYYEMQFKERTAKRTAEGISETVIAGLNQANAEQNQAPQVPAANSFIKK